MTSDPSVAEGLAASRPGVRLRAHQSAVLDQLAETFATGRRRAWVVLPPGLGKTLTGLEAARRLGRPAVVFGPNTAIQGQWVREWSEFRPAPPPARTDRTLGGAVTVLTYQALASFDPDAEVGEEGDGLAGTSRHLSRLRTSGRELVAALRSLDEVTLLLDECHHLLDTWGELLAELLRELPGATVIGLTATPPDRLTASQAALVDELFGPAVRGPSIPAAVRAGHLAPYVELAWLTEPTAAESDWLDDQTTRFRTLTTQLLDPCFAAHPLLSWLDGRIVHRRTADGERSVGWQRFAREHPQLARAALRFHHHGLLELPEGARLAEEHRRAPVAADWVCLLDDWVRGCLRRSADPADARALEAVRAALPAVGYRLTRAGVRAGRAPVDRLLARSAAKSAGALEIAAAEHAALGERLRAVVICDHERATATLPADLSGVLDEQAGSARLLLGRLVADPRTAVLDPLLVTGRTVGAAPATARRFVEFAERRDPGLRLDPLAEQPEADGWVKITGSWTSRRWVALVTDFLAEGGSRLLIGTRGMLGEGWDARGVNTLIDLTEATTATAVVQVRGRALRTGAGWPDKTAHTWSVVCVAPDHPKGGADWDRFVRKHEGYLGLADTGEVLAGVAHVHPDLTPYGPPAVTEFDGFNARMLRRTRERDAARSLWRVGEACEDRLVHSVRITVPAALAARQDARPPGRPGGRSVRAEPPAVVPDRGGVAPAVPRGAAAWAGATVALLSPFPMLALGGPPSLTLLAGAMGGWGAYAGSRGLAGARRLRQVAGEPVLTVIAYAVADGLHAVELVPRGAEGVSVTSDHGGVYRIGMEGVPASVSERFVTALDEAVSPIGDPRYLLPRYVPERQGWRAGRRATRSKLTHAVVHHAVPSLLGGKRSDVDAYAACWNRYVSGGRAVYTRSPEGAGLLAAQAGCSPLDAATALRVGWV